MTPKGGMTDPILYQTTGPEVLTILVHLTKLIAVTAGGTSCILLAWAAISYLSGTPKNKEPARTAITGALAGLIIVGLSFILPRSVEHALLGSAAHQDNQVAHCDSSLRTQLLADRSANDLYTMNLVIARVQAAPHACDDPRWNPVASDLQSAPGCFTADRSSRIGNAWLPRSLRENNEETSPPISTSSRDGAGNILIYWQAANRPSGNAACWLYDSTAQVWESN